VLAAGLLGAALTFVGGGAGALPVLEVVCKAAVGALTDPLCRACFGSAAAGLGGGTLLLGLG
jgi:hypothetical protein